ncbi:MAG: Gfo/Idh/MocA family protein [Chthoniobacterales bacterium]
MSTDGMTHAPKGKPRPVCKEGEFIFAIAHLDHGHIEGMSNGLTEAGGRMKWVYDADPERAKPYLEANPGSKLASSFEQILEDSEVQLVAGAAVPSDRGPIGCQVMKAGKDYFVDKSPFTTLEQLEEARKVQAETQQRYFVYYSERLHSEAGMYASQLVQDGVVGRVIQVLGLGPHRVSIPARPAWFFDKQKYGGIITDIGSHQAEQFLFYTGSKDAEVLSARVENFAHPEYPGLEDFGEWTFKGDSGASGYHRVDWFTPDGLSTWGDGRTIILGTDGYIELRKYLELGRPGEGGDNVYIVNQEKEERVQVTGKIGYPFFGELILDVLNRSEKAMTQEHIFKAAEISLKAQVVADAAHS